MSKSRDNKHRKQRASRKLAEWRIQHASRITVPVEIVGLKGDVPKPLAPH